MAGVERKKEKKKEQRKKELQKCRSKARKSNVWLHSFTSVNFGRKYTKQYPF